MKTKPSQVSARGRAAHPLATANEAARAFRGVLVAFLLAGLLSFAAAQEIHRAAAAGDLATVRLLLERGADPNTMNGYFSTPLSEALAGGHGEVAELLRQHGGLDPLPLLESGDVAGLRRALERKPEWVHFRDQLGATLLFHAVLLRQIAITKLLLEFKADPNIADRWGHTALMPAIATGNVELTALLHQHGADVNRRLNDGTTALFVAARLGHAAIVKLLLARGAHPTIRHRELQTTPLHAAVAASSKPFDVGQLDRLQTASRRT